MRGSSIHDHKQLILERINETPKAVKDTSRCHVFNELIGPWPTSWTFVGNIHRRSLTGAKLSFDFFNLDCLFTGTRSYPKFSEPVPCCGVMRQ